MAGKTSRGQTVKDLIGQTKEIEVYTAGSGSRAGGQALKNFKEGCHG